MRLASAEDKLHACGLRLFAVAGKLGRQRLKYVSLSWS